MKWLILSIVLVGSYSLMQQTQPKTPPDCSPQPVVFPDNSVVSLEVALTPTAQQLGLAKRDRLDANNGMLFLFSQADIRPFWMKDTRIPLDIIWLRNHTVVEIASLQPAPRDSEAEITIPRHVPKEKADAVIELNQGQAQSRHIEIGSAIIWQPCL